MSEHEGFPVDWERWRSQWDQWRQDRAAHLRPTSWRKGGKNFLADEVLGTWEVGGRPVEFSEVTFPGNRGERARYVGLTFIDGAQLVSSWGDLDHALGLAHEDEEG